MERPTSLILGVLNVTPDSFSDGGRFNSLDAALHQAEKMHTEGADFIDVGGESTRPGAENISLQEELDRVIPVVDKIHKNLNVGISIDTRHFEVAKEAVRHGAKVINDITAGQDARLIELAKNDPSVWLLLMHMQGTPQTMQKNPSYPRGVVAEVSEYLLSQVSRFVEAGIKKERIWVDPGIGFGKTLEQNIELLSQLKAFLPIAGRIAVGTSRKSFLAKILGNPELEMEKREAGTLASNLFALEKGASVFRVHNVGAMKRALLTWERLSQ